MAARRPLVNVAGTVQELPTSDTLTGAIGAGVYAATVGNGSATDIAVPHTLGTRDVVVVERDANAPYSFRLVPADATDADTVTLHFDTAPATNSRRVLILSAGAARPAPVSHGSMGSTETFDATAGDYHYGTLDANCTVTLVAGASGVLWELVLELLQDGTGSRTVTWPAAVKWTAGTAPTLTTTANRRDFVTLWTRDGGTTWWGTAGPLNLV